MVVGGFLLVILYILHRYIVAWINFYGNSDERFKKSIWRWTYDYKFIGKKDISDLDDKFFVRKKESETARSHLCTVIFL